MAIHTAPTCPAPTHPAPTHPAPTQLHTPTRLAPLQNASPAEATKEPQPAVDGGNKQQEVVVLIHGLCGHWLAMLPLAHRLRQAGYCPINWGYRSIWGDVATHAKGLQRKLVELEEEPSISTIHVVAHSLGCIVTRQAILNQQPSKLGRVVMLCPPNGGSHMATRLAPVLGPICKALVEITDLPDSWVNRLPTTLPSITSVGVIVASGDLVVAPESTQLPGADERLVIPGMHSAVLLKSATADAAIRFLRTATF